MNTHNNTGGHSNTATMGSFSQQSPVDPVLHPPGRAPTGGQTHSHRPVSAMPAPSARPHVDMHRTELSGGPTGKPSPSAAFNPSYTDRRASAHPTVPVNSMQSNAGSMGPPVIPFGQMDTATSHAIGQGIPITSPAALQYFAAHPRRQQVHFGNYLLLQTLGEGEFGKVKLGVHKEWGEEVAVKLIKRDKVGTADGQLQITGPSKDPAKMSKVEKEIRVLKDVRHPNIVRLYEVIESDRYIGIVLEYASGGELFDHILAHKYLKERDACRLFAQLISGVSYLHQKKIVHRDLKLENLLLDRNRNVIITDFGFANNFENKRDDLMATSCGSPCYAAPELVVQDGLYAGSAVDVWSCGVILYAMLAGYLPFDDDPANPDGDNINLLYKYIMATPLSFPDYIGAQPRDLLCRMLVPDPVKRADLTAVMGHPWLSPYKDLFKFSVDELERAAIEQQNKKRQVYRQQMMMQQQLQDQQRSGGNVNVNNASRGVRGNEGDPQTSIRQQRHQSAMAAPSVVPDRIHDLPQNTRSRPTTGVPVPRFEADDVDMTSNKPISSHSKNYSNHRVDPGHSNDGSSAVSKVPAGSKTQRHTVQLEYDSGNTSSMAVPTRRTAHEGIDNKIAESIRQTNSSSPPRSVPLVGKHEHIVEDDNPRHSKSINGRDDGAFAHIPATGVAVTGILHEADTPISKGASSVKAPSETTVTPITPSPTVNGHSQSRRRSSATPARVSSNPLPQNEHAIDDPKVNRQQNRVLSSDTSSNKLATDNKDRNTLLQEQVNQQPVVEGERNQARHRKGMSTDKFFLTKLLGSQGGSPSNDVLQQIRGQEERRDNGVRSHDYVLNEVKAQSTTSVTPERVSTASGPSKPSSEQEKFGRRTSGSRRKALSLMVSRPEEVQEKSDKAVKSERRLTARLHKETLLSKDNKRPETPSRTISNPSGKPSPSAASVITNNTSASTRTSSSIFKRSNNGGNLPFDNSLNESTSTVGASSSAAKKVMDWFRKKSLSRTQLDEKSTAGPFDSPSSAVSSSRRSRKVSTLLPSTNNRESNALNQSPIAVGTGASNTENSNMASVATPKLVVTDDSAENVQNSLSHSYQAGLDSLPSSRSTSGTHSQTSQVTQSTGLTSATEGSNVRSDSNNSHIPVSKSSASTVQQQATPKASSSVVNRIDDSGQQRSQTKKAEGLQNKVGGTKSKSVPDSALRVHQGAVDQSALTSRSPDDVFAQVQRALWLMGIEAKKEGEEPYKLECVRRRRNKTLIGAATQNLGLSIRTSVFPPSQADFERSSNNAGSLNHTNNSTLSPSPSSVRTFLRRGSSHSGHLAKNNNADNTEEQIPSPLYGEPSVDGGQEVRFSVEVTRLKNLPGLYSVDIRRMKGNLWAYKFIYHAMLDRCDLSGSGV